MIVVILVVGLAVAAALAGGARWSASRSVRRSVEGYEHALGVLGDVSKRSERMAPVRPPAADEVARPHVRPASDDDRTVPFPDVPDPLRQAVTVPSIDAAATSAEDASASDEVTGAELLGAATATAAEPEGAVAAVSQLAAAKSRRRRHEIGYRTIAKSAAVVVFVGAIVGAWQLSRGGAAPSPAPTPPTPAAHHRTTRARTVVPSSPAPTTLEPMSTSSTLVTYAAPAGAYTVTFHAKGACWIGVRTSESGQWLWMKTLAAGQSATYSATGPIDVRVGAPPEVSLSVNGRSVDLPPANVNPFDAMFVTSSTGSTST